MLITDFRKSSCRRSLASTSLVRTSSSYDERSEEHMHAKNGVYNETHDTTEQGARGDAWSFEIEQSETRSVKFVITKSSPCDKVTGLVLRDMKALTCIDCCISFSFTVSAADLSSSSFFVSIMSSRIFRAFPSPADISFERAPFRSRSSCIFVLAAPFSDFN